MDINKYMTPRLFAVASFAENESTVADVGTDHAYIPVYLVKKGVSNSAIAMDINEGPLLRAKENIEKFNLQDKIKTRLSDGLKELKEGECNTVIIAGMGGILINRILENATNLYPYIKHYILQPMTAIEETRKFLEENGFFIESERLAKEEDKIYTIISAKRGEMEIENEIDYYIGKKLIENKDELLNDLLCGKIYELNKAIESMKNTEKSEILQKRNHFIYLRDEMEKIKEECIKW